MSIICRGVRGAITVDEDKAELIIAAAVDLLKAVIAANGILEQDVASVFFTTTPDLRMAYPAAAARQLGWHQVALMGAQEMDNPNGLPRMLRVLIHWNTEKGLDEIVHVYMRGAEKLRPDLYPANKLILNEERES